jgi:hypothetical protein
MTLSSTQTKVTYVGNGSTTVFAIPFTIYDNDNFEVILREESTTPDTETTQSIGTHYTISGGDPGSSITMLIAPSSTQKLIIRRVMPVTQTVDYVNTSVFPAETHELALDRIVAQIQDVNEVLSRVPKLSKTSSASTQLPEPSAESYLRINSAGTELEWATGVTGGAAAIPGTLAGDILVYSVSAYNRLEVGSDGQVLTAASGETLGVKWGGAPSGGGTAVWMGDTDAPLEEVEFNEKVWKYGSGGSQYLYLYMKVPSSYTAGVQVRMRLGLYSSASSFTIGFTSISYLYENNVTDLSTVSANTHTSTPTPLTNTVSYAFREIVMDITDATGQINSVAIAAGDIIKVRLERNAAQTDTADLRFIPSATEILWT